MKSCHLLFKSGFIVLLTSLALVASSATYAQKSTRRKTAKPVTFQGICGTVVVKQGNFMPGPDRPARTGQPVEREVLIFPLLNLSQVDAGDNGFIKSVRNAKPMKTVKSGKDGKFCVSLPAGQYSVLVQEPKGLYANLSDAHSNIFPVTVQKNRKSDVQVEISHQAVF
jgi:hypothetical protein